MREVFIFIKDGDFELSDWFDCVGLVQRERRRFLVFGGIMLVRRVGVNFCRRGELFGVVYLCMFSFYLICYWWKRGWVYFFYRVKGLGWSVFWCWFVVSLVSGKFVISLGSQVYNLVVKILCGLVVILVLVDF